MFTAAMIRTAFVSAWLASGALASAPASAELPEHLVVDGIGPGGADFEVEGPGEPPITFNLLFGETVAMRNGVAFVSIPLSHGGRVAVLNQTPTGWRGVQTLNAPIPDADFGRTITFRDGLVIVGDATSAYVYKRNSSGVWTLRQTLRPPVADAVALFPVALKYEGGTLLASAFHDTLPNLVYVFELGADGRFVRRARLRALDARPFDDFGRSLSMTKTALVVGARGAAYIFRRNSLGDWVQTQKLTPVATATGFGASVAIDQDMIIVGAPQEDIETEFDTPDAHWAGGAAYVFLPVAGRYLESLRLRPRVDERFDYRNFGTHVAMFDRYIAISAVGRPTFISSAAEGIVFTYTRDGSTVLARGIASSHFQSASGNISLALANNWLMVGHLGDERCPFGCPGAATVYDVNRFQQ
ncbi:MAG TPA: FG-GAP repeat protein [Steroidobacteraceae bacterium]|nr:FG-GAP repeat protein [Steroidobacteraceae bacterium]